MAHVLRNRATTADGEAHFPGTLVAALTNGESSGDASSLLLEAFLGASYSPAEFAADFTPAQNARARLEGADLAQVLGRNPNAPTPGRAGVPQWQTAADILGLPSDPDPSFSELRGPRRNASSTTQQGAPPSTVIPSSSSNAQVPDTTAARNARAEAAEARARAASRTDRTQSDAQSNRNHNSYIGFITRQGAEEEEQGVQPGDPIDSSILLQRQAASNNVASPSHRRAAQPVLPATQDRGVPGRGTGLPPPSQGAPSPTAVRTRESSSSMAPPGRWVSGSFAASSGNMQSALQRTTLSELALRLPEASSVDTASNRAGRTRASPAGGGWRPASRGSTGIQQGPHSASAPQLEANLQSRPIVGRRRYGPM